MGMDTAALHPPEQTAPMTQQQMTIPWDFVEPNDRKQELLYRIKDASHTDPLVLAETLREMEMYDYTYVDTCKAINAIFGILIRIGDRSADLLAACISALKGCVKELMMCDDTRYPRFLGVPDDELCKKLIRMLADPSLRSRADKDILCCVSQLVRHNALTARCVDIRPVFACIRFHLRWERNPFILSEGATLIRVLLERDFSIACMCENRVGDVLARIFLTVNDTKTADCIHCCVMLVMKSRRFRLMLYDMNCQKSMAKRLVRLLRTPSVSKLKPEQVSDTLRFMAILIQGNPTFKPLLFPILPCIMATLGRYLNQAPRIVEDVTRLYMYLARGATPRMATSLQPIIGPLLIIIFRYGSFTIGKVACSALLELCSISKTAKLCLLQHISETDLHRIFPKQKANVISSVLHARRN